MARWYPHMDANVQDQQPPSSVVRTQIQAHRRCRAGSPQSVRFTSMDHQRYTHMRSSPTRHHQNVDDLSLPDDNLNFARQFEASTLLYVSPLHLVVNAEATKGRTMDRDDVGCTVELQKKPWRN
ncbi:hypothetical protein BDA96_08G148400 [Sorghum bicolor]|uniref:Uncharacterized protein n=1 Tax=Sorghum bicolor TaxID=4558 RepID=A0A921U848_SORBI|nr:hypothetical protein BDA96_08G148400 [Sorghum bicolor]